MSSRQSAATRELNGEASGRFQSATRGSLGQAWLMVGLPVATQA